MILFVHLYKKNVYHFVNYFNLIIKNVLFLLSLTCKVGKRILIGIGTFFENELITFLHKLVKIKYIKKYMFAIHIYAIL